MEAYVLGSKPIPENFVYGSKETLGLLKESLGIASARDGTACGGLTYDLTKHISGVNFEKAVGGCEARGSAQGMEALQSSCNSSTLAGLATFQHHKHRTTSSA